MWKVKYNTNEPIYETDIENRCVVAKGAGLRRGKFWEFGISGCKVLYMEWMNNKGSHRDLYSVSCDKP